MKNQKTYTADEIGSLFNRSQLANAVSYTTCYEWTVDDVLNGIDRENGRIEKSPISIKRNMIDWILDWLDDDSIPEQEDIIEFITNVNNEGRR